MLKVFVAVLVLLASIDVASLASAAEQSRDGIRSTGRAGVTSERRHSKRTAQHVTQPSSRLRADEGPWVGSRTDFAGNSYFYFRTGVGTPFGPGRVLR